MRNKKITAITLCPLFAALSAISAFIKIPVGFVPFTMQFFVVVLSGLLLGSKLGALSQGLYVILGLLGLPIFTAGGGIGYVLTPTFGYLLGFIGSAFISGYIVEKSKSKSLWVYVLALISALIVTYSFGVAHLYLIKNIYLSNPISLFNAIYYGALIFIPADIITGLLAVVIARRMESYIKKTRLI